MEYLDEMRREESECVIKWYVTDNFPDTFKEEYPSKDMSEYYVDQSIYNKHIAGLHLVSVYLPYGLQKIDNWFFYQLTNKSKYSLNELEKMIKVNPHLHNVIKTNLINNLKCIRKNTQKKI